MITPVMSNITVLFKNEFSTESSAITANEPISAAEMLRMYPLTDIPPMEMLPPKNITTMATPRLAPLSMPRMDGPARGLRNDVCSKSPQVANAAPAKVAVSICGMRLCQMMYDQDECPSISSPKSMLAMSLAGMSTAPHKMLATIRHSMMEVHHHRGLPGIL